MSYEKLIEKVAKLWVDGGGNVNSLEFYLPNLRHEIRYQLKLRMESAPACINHVYKMNTELGVSFCVYCGQQAEIWKGK